MQSICAAELCSGCEGCVNVCPQNAISMQGDIYGFMRPVVDNNRCIDCGLCVSICPAEKDIEAKYPQRVYATYSKESKDRDSSASGGASSVLAKWFVNQGGVVYGCSQENAETIHHIRIDNIKDLYRIKGSKYVQSIIGCTYKQIKEDLRNGLRVMFFGTPCQVAGLKSFMKDKCDNLLLIDICCHGVPSQQLMLDNVRRIKECYHINYDNSQLRVAFRRKHPEVDFGFHVDAVQQSENPEIQYGFFLGGGCDSKSMHEVYGRLENKDYYIYGFLNGVFFRPNCYKCKYAVSNRVSDITLADFWGLGRSDDPEMKERRGVSAVLLNTEKGKKLFEEIIDLVNYEERPVEEAIKGNPQLMHPYPLSDSHNVFMDLYPKVGFVKACRKSFGRRMLKNRMRAFLRSSLFITYRYRRIKYGSK